MNEKIRYDKRYYKSLKAYLSRLNDRVYVSYRSRDEYTGVVLEANAWDDVRLRFELWGGSYQVTTVISIGYKIHIHLDIPINGEDCPKIEEEIIAKLNSIFEDVSTLGNNALNFIKGLE